MLGSIEYEFRARSRTGISAKPGENKAAQKIYSNVFDVKGSL